jgi:hypothetical protein
MHYTESFNNKILNTIKEGKQGNKNKYPLIIYYIVVHLAAQGNKFCPNINFPIDGMVTCKKAT